MWSLVNALLLWGATQSFDAREIARFPRSLISYVTRPVLASEDVANRQDDPVVKQAINAMLSELKQAGFTNPSQGVWIQSQDGAIASGNLSSNPLPAASLTKIVTTLASLQTFGANHRFITTISQTGKIKDGTLNGDLIIEGEGDPFFVWEDAIAIANKLNKLGIKRVTGNLIVTGKFSMNYESNLLESAKFLRQAFDSSQWEGEVAEQYAKMPAGTAQPQLVISGNVQIMPNGSTTQAATNIPDRKLLIRHRSLPLWLILKNMNIFSNNESLQKICVSMIGG
jgi:D-alanyl-D-alanine carboxypeptidase/D-alanyl-D-alanine-endopeptidase (penicillin-binding protein 4)